MKKIIFRAKDITAEIIDAPPKKATAFIPEWYKNMSPFRNGQKKFYWPNDDATPSTIKKCVPFLDAMMAGYVVYTTEEILVVNDGHSLQMRYLSTERKLIDSHPAEQYQGMQIPPEYISEIAFKWQNFWTAKTPKGYSLFFTHPVNRLDLPFLTLSGFVDSDSYERVVNFPFFLKKDFQGIIPIGTPIAQFFPVKREKWVSQVKKFDEKKNIKTFQNTFIDYYKKNFWVRKDYS
jgi:hypothetical protein